MTVTRKQILPALHKSDKVKNPDMPNIEDSNYTSTILKYANLALPFPQLDTNAKTVVAAINELYHTKSTVIPNPPDTPTDNLYTVKIDGDTYRISGGSTVIPNPPVPTSGVVITEDGQIIITEGGDGLLPEQSGPSPVLPKLYTIGIDGEIYEVAGGSGGGYTVGRGLFLSDENTVINADVGVTYSGDRYVTYYKEVTAQWKAVSGVTVMQDIFKGDDSTKRFLLTHPAVELIGVIFNSDGVATATLSNNYIVFDSAPDRYTKITAVYSSTDAGGYSLYQSDEGTYNSDLGHSDCTISFSGYNAIRMFVKQDDDLRDGQYNKHEYLELAPLDVPPDLYDSYGVGSFYYGYKIYNYRLPNYVCRMATVSGEAGSLSVRYHKDIDYGHDTITADGSTYLFNISQPYGTITSVTIDDEIIPYDKLASGAILFHTVDKFSGDGETLAFVLPHRAHRVTDVEVNWRDQPYSLSSDGYTVTLYSAPPEGHNNVRITCEFYPNEGSVVDIDYTKINTHRAYMCAIPDEVFIQTYTHNPYFDGDGVTTEFDLAKRVSSIVSVTISNNVIDPSRYTLKDNHILALKFAPADGTWIKCDYTVDRGEVFNTYDFSDPQHNYALGDYSHAEGFQTKALSHYAHSEGYDTIANRYSHAEGSGSRALGNDGAHAEGYECYAIGPKSHAEGLSTRAYAEDSHTEGKETITYGYGSHAEGDNTKAIGERSHAEGDHSVARGLFSHTEGDYTESKGHYSHAEGHKSVTEGSASHAEGDTTVAVGTASHSEGYHTSAGNSYAHAEGYHTQANGESSHAEGYHTNIQASYAHVEGSGASIDVKLPDGTIGMQYVAGNILGYYSHVEGQLTGVGPNAHCSHVEGIANALYEPFSKNRKYYLGEIAGRQIKPLEYQWFRCIKAYTDEDVGNIDITNESYWERYYSDSIDDFYACFYIDSQGNKYYGSTSLAIGGHAEGRSTLVFGVAGHAEGGGSHAIGIESHAEGGGTRAYGNWSHSEGAGTHAYGMESHAEGAGSIVIGNYAHVEGPGNVAIATGSHVEGSGNRNICSAEFSHMEGSGNRSYSAKAHAEGAGNSVSGEESHVEGAGNQIHGEKVHGEGGGNFGYGVGSHIEGKHNALAGFGVHAEGINNFIGFSSVPASFNRSSTYSVGNIVGVNAEYAVNENETSISYIYRCITAPGQVTTRSGIDFITPQVWDENTTYPTDSVVMVIVNGSSFSYFYNKAESTGQNPITGNGWDRITTLLSPMRGRTSTGYENWHATGNGRYTGWSMPASARYGVRLAYSRVDGVDVPATIENGRVVRFETAPPSGSLVEWGWETPVYYLPDVDSEVGTSIYIIRVASNETIAPLWEKVPSPVQGTHIEGLGNIALGSYQHVGGKYNVADANKAIIIGNGVDGSNRANAYTLDWNGNATFAGDITLGTTLSTTAQTVAAAINELYQTGGGSQVSVTQKVSTGTNIADIIVDGVTTQLFAPTSGGSNVIVTPVQLSGNHIADIEVDGVTSELYSPEYTPTEVEVTQVQSSGAKIATIEVDGSETDIYAPEAVGSVTIDDTLSTGTKVATITVDGVDTEILVPDAGDSVTVTQITSTGTHIADIEVDGVTTELYAPNAAGAVIDDNDIALDKTWSSYKINEMFFELAQRVAAIERYLWGQPVLTEDGDNRVTEDGAQRILEENEE